MQSLDHTAIKRDHAFVLVLRKIEGRDDLAGLRDLLGAWRESRVGTSDLARMDQRLAVKTEVARLATLPREPFRVGDVVVNAIEDVETIGASRRHAAH